jgi:hypothetical protein
MEEEIHGMLTGAHLLRYSTCAPLATIGQFLRDNKNTLDAVSRVVGGEDTYNPDDVNIWRYGARRGSVNKIYFKE